MKAKVLLVALISGSCAILASLSLQFGPYERLELKTLDARFRLFPRPQRASREVVIVDADDRSLEEFSRRGVAWPWPRHDYADLVRSLSRSGAKAIVFDGLYSEPDLFRPGRPAGSSDREFAAAMREAGNVVLSAELTSHKILVLGDNPLVRPPNLRVTPSSHSPNAGGHAVLPLALFQKNAAMVGAMNYTQDADGTVRRQSLYFFADAFPQVALAAYLTARRIDHIAFLRPDLLSVGDELIPLDARGCFRIFWYGPDTQTFRHDSFCDLVSPFRGSGSDKPSAATRAAFQGKIVVVGVSAHGAGTSARTPYTTSYVSSSSEILATLISNLLQRDFLVRAPAAVPVAAAFLLSALICVLFLFGPGLFPVTLAALVGACAWLGLSAWLFASRGLWLDVVAPLAALGIAFASAAAMS